jgi:fructokinase
MVCVIGEAVIDLVADIANDEVAANDNPRYTAYPGGSPFNVAIGLARLGQQTQLLARLSQDRFGRQLRAHAIRNGVDLSIAVAASEPSTLAVVGLDENSNASYDFYVTGTSDWQWTEAELGKMPPETNWLHLGSLAALTAPGAEAIEAHIGRVRRAGKVMISYDPNMRPELVPDRAVAVATVERLVRTCDVVKASAEDMEWLYPGIDIVESGIRWKGLGPSLVVVTDGGKGAHVIAGDGPVVTVPGLVVSVVDTVGAGDAFMAGLINAVLRVGVHPRDLGAALLPVIEDAILVAALTCAQAGANPPTSADLLAAR